MPLCSVTSTKRSVRVPSAADGQVVAKQAVAKRVARGKDGILQRLARPEHLPLDDIDVEIAIVVVVEQADAGGHDLGVIDLPGHAVEVDEVEPGLPGALDEPFTGRRIGRDAAGVASSPFPPPHAADPSTHAARTASPMALTIEEFSVQRNSQPPSWSWEFRAPASDYRLRV